MIAPSFDDFAQLALEIAAQMR